MTIGTYLKQCRELEGVTQEDLAMYLGLSSPQYISNVERGYCKPTTKRLPVWCDYIGANRKKVLAILSMDYNNKVKRELGI